MFFLVFPHFRAVLIGKKNHEYDAGTDAGADGFQMLEGKLLLQKITLLCLSCSQIFRRTNYVILDFPCNWISCKWNSIKLSLEESEHIFPQDYSLMLKGDSAFLCVSSLTKHFL